MRALVTGAGGNIGRAVVGHLRASGVDVLGLSLEPVDLGGVLVGDAADPTAVAAAFDRGPFDVVVHLAAIPAPALGSAVEVFGGNTLATFVVLDEAGRRGVPRAVIASSYALLGMPFSPHEAHPAYYPLDIDTPPQPADPYALGKLVDEHTAAMMHRRYGTTVVALRFPFTAGTERLEATVAQLRADPAEGARNSWAYLHLDDAAEAVRLASSVHLEGFHRFFLAAPETFCLEPTEELIARHHPGVPVRRPIPGRRVPIDTSPIEETLGFFTAFHLP